MDKVPISKTKIETKLAIIRESLSSLEDLASLSKKEFISKDESFAVAEHYLRRSLEAIFDISGHIISRFPMSPGKRPSTYKDVAKALADKDIIKKDFGKETLVKMAGYRNRLVHFYDEIDDEEMYEIITENLSDIEKFAKSIVNVLKNPEEFNLTVSEE